MASYRLSPVEAATAASQAERTLPPLPHLCSACTPHACHASAGSVLQPPADLIYHVTNGTKHRQIHKDPAGLLAKTKLGAKTPILTSGLSRFLITSTVSRSLLINIRSHVNVFYVPLTCQNRSLACSNQEISKFRFTHSPGESSRDRAN